MHEHIAAFGGDPERVTINGQSAGASSVELHMVANEGKDALFSGAIAQSVDREILPQLEEQVVSVLFLLLSILYIILSDNIPLICFLLIIASVQLLRRTSWLWWTRLRLLYYCLSSQSIH